MIGKPIASLSSGLLARKGQARPAMRPQGFLQLSPVGAQEDLGWNDMGHDFPSAAPVPMPHVAFEEPVEASKPAVLRQIEALDEQLAAPMAEAQPAPEPQPEPEPTPVLAKRIKREPVLKAPMPEAVIERVGQEVAAKKAKAAFTLRLDHDRHLRLRLASAVTRRSAQQLVTQALDQFLESIGEIDALARQIDQTPDQG